MKLLLDSRTARLIHECMLRAGFVKTGDRAAAAGGTRFGMSLCRLIPAAAVGLLLSAPLLLLHRWPFEAAAGFCAALFLLPAIMGSWSIEAVGGDLWQSAEMLKNTPASEALVRSVQQQRFNAEVCRIIISRMILAAAVVAVACFTHGSPFTSRSLIAGAGAALLIGMQISAVSVLLFGLQFRGKDTVLSALFWIIIVGGAFLAVHAGAVWLGSGAAPPPGKHLENLGRSLAAFFPAAPALLWTGGALPPPRTFIVTALLAVLCWPALGRISHYVKDRFQNASIPPDAVDDGFDSPDEGAPEAIQPTGEAVAIMLRRRPLPEEEDDQNLDTAKDAALHPEWNELLPHPGEAAQPGFVGVMAGRISEFLSGQPAAPAPIGAAPSAGTWRGSFRIMAVLLFKAAIVCCLLAAFIAPWVCHAYIIYAFIAFRSTVAEPVGAEENATEKTQPDYLRLHAQCPLEFTGWWRRKLAIARKSAVAFLPVLPLPLLLTAVAAGGAALVRAAGKEVPDGLLYAASPASLLTGITSGIAVCCLCFLVPAVHLAGLLKRYRFLKGWRTRRWAAFLALNFLKFSPLAAAAALIAVINGFGSQTLLLSLAGAALLLFIILRGPVNRLLISLHLHGRADHVD